MKERMNENTVVIVSGQTSGTYLKLAEELQNVLDRRDTYEMRILPVTGTPGPQNLMDILFLRGVDMCMTETDYFDYFKALDPELYGGIEKKIHYIAKLYNTEFHIVAKRHITSLEQLRGKKVNFYNRLSSADISGRNLFKLLGIEVEALNLDQPTATARLKSGEIDAVLRLAGAPVEAFSGIKPEDGLHFVSIDPASLAASERGRFTTVLKTYLPAKLRAEDYPALIPAGGTVSTVASSVVLAVYAWPEGTDRYRRVAKFVNAFFDNFDKLRAAQRHPKWQATNLAAEVPGWTRFKAAQQWLDGKRVEIAADAGRSDPMVAGFQEFLVAYRARNPKANLSETQAQALFSEFVKWRAVQSEAAPQ
jgi:TRAP-type uncharacterized transport system substrate-binding protein